MFSITNILNQKMRIAISTFETEESMLLDNHSIDVSYCRGTCDNECDYSCYDSCKNSCERDCTSRLTF